MKQKNDYILGPASSLMDIQCINCGITSENHLDLTFWTSVDGKELCSNCNCTQLAKKVRELIDENTKLLEEKGKIIAASIKSQAELGQAYEKKLAEYEGKT